MKKFEALSAMLPCYTATGDLTKLYFNTGAVSETPRKIDSLLHSMASDYACDLTALRHQSALRTGHTHLQPLPFSNQLLLVPIKVRTAKIPGDPTLAYVNKYAIKKIQRTTQAPYLTEIFLTENQCLLSLWTIKTVEQAMRQAQLATIVSTKDGQVASLALKIVELWQFFRNLHA
jgi:hypothetical protein